MTTRCPHILSALIAVSLLVGAESALAQNFGAGGGGARGQRYGLGIQATNAGQMGTSPRNLGGTSGGGRGGVGGGGQQGGFGQGGFGQAGQQGQALGPGGQQQDQFIGRDAQDARNVLDTLNGRDRRNFMFDMLVENLSEMRDQGRRFEAQNTTPTPARVRLVPAFTAPTIVSTGAPATVVQARLNQTVTLPELPGVSGPNVSMNGRVATVTGTVATEHDRKLVEKLISIQAGVSTVDNQLVVATPAEGAPTEQSAAE